MITIIGKDPSVAKRITCRNCGSILEYHTKDVTEVIGKDYGGGTDIRNYIICPVCAKEVTTYHG